MLSVHRVLGREFGEAVSLEEAAIDGGLVPRALVSLTEPVECLDGRLPKACGSDPETADLIEDAIDQLAEEGPVLGRPLADRVRGSRFHNMKELRPPSAGGTEIRMLFAFDPRRGLAALAEGRFG